MTTQTQLCKIVSPKAEKTIKSNFDKLKRSSEFINSAGERALAFISFQGLKTHPVIFVTFRAKSDSDYSAGSFQSRTIFRKKDIVMVDLNISEFMKTAFSLRLNPELQIESVLAYKFARLSDDFSLLGDLQQKLWNRHNSIVNGKLSLYFQNAMLQFMPSGSKLGGMVNTNLYETIISLEAAIFASKCLASFIERKFLMANVTPSQFQDWIKNGLTRDTSLGGAFVDKLETRRGWGARELLMPSSAEIKKPMLYAKRLNELYESIRNS